MPVVETYIPRSEPFQAVTDYLYDVPQSMVFRSSYHESHIKKLLNAREFVDEPEKQVRATRVM